MKKEDAITIMIDVALKRKPHSRVAINLARHLLEPPSKPQKRAPAARKTEQLD